MDAEYYLYKQKVIADYEYITFMQNKQPKIIDNEECKKKIIEEYKENKIDKTYNMKLGEYFCIKKNENENKEENKELFDTETREKIRNRIKDSYERKLFGY
jgi:hypothetical protein